MATSKILKWVIKAEAKIKELEHYRDTTLGLYATDRPDLVKDEHKAKALTKKEVEQE
ncbi:hypothetical protein LCGC14_1637770, partial [marine sediment metagenome]